MHIAHLTSVHPRGDTRVFHKMCRAAVEEGHCVSLIVADGQGDVRSCGVDIIDAGRSETRIARVLDAPGRVARKAVAVEPDIYHLHDPELIPMGLKLRSAGRRVIFDAHEDLPQQIRSKGYIPPILRGSLSVIVGAVEAKVCKRFDAVIAATPHIHAKFERFGARTLTVANYPRLDEFLPAPDQAGTKTSACYVGGISPARGILELLEAARHVSAPVRIGLAGSFETQAFEAQCKAHPGWARVDELGFLDRSGVRETMTKSFAGLVTLRPTTAYIDSLPVKMFEYMASGIPVIASNFPLWRSIIEQHDCGICVDPADPIAIAGAIDRLATNSEEAERMGRNGRKAIVSRYNWEAEKRSLIELYGAIMSSRPDPQFRPA